MSETPFEKLKRIGKFLFRNALPRTRKSNFAQDASEKEQVTFQVTQKQAMVITFAVSLLNEITHGGGTALPVALTRSIARVLGKVLPRQLQDDVQLEVAEVLDWLSSELALLPPDDEPWPSWQETETDLDQHVATIEDAISRSQELQIDYYSHWRQEMTSRRVTPIRLDDGRYLHGYCHLRKDDRVFRLSRIHAIAVVEAEHSDRPKLTEGAAH